MAYYPKPGDDSRDMYALQEQVRRIRTRRPLVGHVPSPGWSWHGVVDIDSYFSPQPIKLDPRGNEDYLEEKYVIGFDGFVLSAGLLVVNWVHWNEDFILEGHEISGDTNYVELDVPYRVPPGGMLIQPEVVSATGVEHASLNYSVEVEPV